MLVHRAHPRHLSVVISAQAEIQHSGATFPRLSIAWIPRLFLLIGAEDDDL
jgi:hypothetical protein